jgi:predicted small lipoprotein YifL
MRTFMKSPWLTLIVIALLSFGLADCGKKGPPLPPEEEPEQVSPQEPPDPEKSDSQGY